MRAHVNDGVVPGVVDKDLEAAVVVVDLGFLVVEEQVHVVEDAGCRYWLVLGDVICVTFKKALVSFSPVYYLFYIFV